MMVNIKMIKEKGKVLSSLKGEIHMREISRIIISMEKENTYIKMEIHMKVILKRIILKEKEPLPSKMEINMKEVGKMI